MATLKLIPASGSPIVIDAEQAIVGRDPSCDVVVNDGSVSRKHARLEQRGGGWAVVDQGSANGTFLDSQRIAETVLRPGQELRFGAVPFQIDIEYDEVGATILTPMPAVTDATIVHQAAVVAPRPAAARPHAPAPPPAARPRFDKPGSPPPPPPSAAPRPHAPAPSPVPPMPPPPAPEAKKRGPLFWGGVGCCGCLTLLLLGGVIATMSGVDVVQRFIALTSAPVEAARAQLQDIKDGKLEAAYARFSSAYQASHSAEDFAAFVERHPGLKAGTDSTFSSRMIENDTAKISGSLTHADGLESVSYELVKEGEEWKISGLTVEGDSGVATVADSDGGMTVETIAVNKVPQGQTVVVKIDFRVAGFDMRPEGGLFRMDLAEDLETFGPDGQRIDELSRVGLETVNKTESSAIGAAATFSNSLTCKLEPGKHKAVITIRDMVGLKIKKHEVLFDLP